MNRILLTLVVGVSAAFALAQAPGKKPPLPKAVKCPVMKASKVNIASATKAKMFADYKGRRYFFCCAGCPEAFKANPAKFAKGAESIPTPKKPKKG
jgi:YHS domain-containing protein